LANILPPEHLTIIVNTGDDFEHLGLTICPDLDTVSYTLAGLANPKTGWGVKDESWNTMAALARYGGPTWFRLGDRDLAEPQSLIKAAKRAYAMAGVSDPSQEIQVAEVTEYYSYQELLWTEGLGLCDRGMGGRMVQSGVSSLSGRLPVNPSGGVLAGNPYTVAGLVRVAEAYLQLNGSAGEHQVEGVRRAVAHGTTGPCGQSHCVIVLTNQ
jgi:acetyl-CoA acetyltransferase